MNERQPSTQPVEGTPHTEHPEVQRYKTLAVRLDEGQHAQLRFIAQLNDTSIAEEIRGSIQARIDAASDDPDLIARAEQVQQEIEREAAARAAAIAGFLGASAAAAAASSPTQEGAARPRRSSKTTKG